MSVEETITSNNKKETGENASPSATTSATTSTTSSSATTNSAPEKQGNVNLTDLETRCRLLEGT